MEETKQFSASTARLKSQPQSNKREKKRRQFGGEGGIAPVQSGTEEVYKNQNASKEAHTDTPLGKKRHRSVEKKKLLTGNAQREKENERERETQKTRGRSMQRCVTHKHTHTHTYNGERKRRKQREKQIKHIIFSSQKEPRRAGTKRKALRKGERKKKAQSFEKSER